ncbi:unnamed protein product [Lampetra planeri]
MSPRVEEEEGLLVHAGRPRATQNPEQLDEEPGRANRAGGTWRGSMENLLDIRESEESEEEKQEADAAGAPVAEQRPDVPSEAAACDRDDVATSCRSCGRPSEWPLHVAAGGPPERTWFCCQALWETAREAWGHEVRAPWPDEDAEGPNRAVLVQERRDRIVARILERQDGRALASCTAPSRSRCPPTPRSRTPPPLHGSPGPGHTHGYSAMGPLSPRGPLIPGDVCAQRGDVVERFYEGGRKFSTFFADGTGQVLYPSEGRRARIAIQVHLYTRGFGTTQHSGDPAGHVVLQAVRGPGGPLVWVVWAQGGRVLAVLGAAGGGAVCVSASGGVRLVVTPSGGRCYGARGWETRRWLWEDAAGHHEHHGHHAHAPPLQPVDVPLGARAPRVRLLTREDALLTYVARNRSVRLRVAYQPPGGSEATERGPDSAASAATEATEATEASEERALGALVARIRAALGGLRRAGRASDTNAERPSRVA